MDDDDLGGRHGRRIAAAKEQACQQQCSYCGCWYSTPVSLHHTLAECIAEISTLKRPDAGGITHDEWYGALNQIAAAQAALEAVANELTTEIDGHVYVPSGYRHVVELVREALKTLNEYRERELKETPPSPGGKDG